jgi:hypothetical protein
MSKGGRGIKKGLEYFPMDANLFSDIKIRKLIKYQGGKAVTVYTCLLCIIYKDGYYMRWDNELPFTISELTGFEEAYIQEVIKCCLNIGLFSKDLFDTVSVITSLGIQKRYDEICKLSKRKAIISEFNLISSEELPINSEETSINSELMQQSKGKESKVKESKENGFFLVQEISKQFYKTNVFYAKDEIKDFQALKIFAEFISGKKFSRTDFSNLDQDRQLEILNEFELVSNWYKKKNCTKSLETLAKFSIQQIFTESNGERTKNTGQGRVIFDKA